jgi:hypothetical protein
MRRPLFRRSSRSRWIRFALILFVIVNFLDVLRVHRILSSSQTSHINKPNGSRAEKIFIASTHWNNEIILRSHWNKAVVELAEYFGPEKIYVSVYESGSWDDSKGALRALNQSLEKLGVKSRIILDTETHIDAINKPPAASGWIDTRRGKRELRRIPYLADLRNRSLQSLEQLALEGMKFDKILFLNDVIFTVRLQ